MKISLLILGMALVTFLPRFLPSLVVDRIKLNSHLETFLRLIPYTAMTALVFPGVFSVGGDRWHVGAVGAAVAILLSFFPKIPSGVVVIASVLSILLFFI